jgi:hypothetical protein
VQQVGTTRALKKTLEAVTPPEPRLADQAALLCIRHNEVPHSNKPGITQACYNVVSVNSGPSHPHDDPGAQTMRHQPTVHDSASHPQAHKFSEGSNMHKA